jgi:hypothetical protein
VTFYTWTVRETDKRTEGEVHTSCTEVIRSSEIEGVHTKEMMILCDDESKFMEEEEEEEEMERKK